LTVERLKQNGITDFQVIDIHSANVDISGKGSIIVVMPVTGSGETLLNLNRNLRISRHDGNRIFISPFVVHSSSSSFDDLRSSLSFGPKGFKYQFFSQHNVFIGHDKEDSSWELELDFIDNFENDFWERRADYLRRMDDGLRGRIGVSSLDPDSQLVFSQDFAFWAQKYEIADTDPESVYVTVAAIIQSLREKPIEDNDSDSLFNYVYQHSILAPDNFVRFNDPLLQSCIWRAADSRELDYRSSLEISKSFMDILTRLVKESQQGGENAAIDLLIGIGLGRIQIANEVLLPTLKEYLETYPDSMKHASMLISQIISDLSGEVVDQPEIQF
jgi:hypothetical protein